MGFLRNPRSIAAIVLAASTCVALVLLAPSPNAAGANPSADGTVEVSLRDGEIALDDAEVGAGPVRFSVVNEGTGQHEFVLIRTDSDPAELPVGLFGVSLARAGALIVGEDHSVHAHAHDEVGGLAPERTLSANPSLRPGRYVILCNIDDHYRQGEWAELIVAPRPG